MRSIRLADAKTAASEDLPPGHPGREALLALSDELSEREFDAIFPTLVRLLKVSRSVCGAPVPSQVGNCQRRDFNDDFDTGDLP